MEINAEINKVFGEEMAKIFAASISQDEMMTKAKDIWRELTTVKDCWGYDKSPELERYIKKEFLREVHDKILEILKEPQNEEEIEKRAREMVEKATRIGEEAIIRTMAQRMVENILSKYDDNSHFVNEIMRELKVEESGGIR